VVSAIFVVFVALVALVVFVVAAFVIFVTFVVAAFVAFVLFVVQWSSRCESTSDRATLTRSSTHNGLNRTSAPSSRSSFSRLSSMH